MVLGRNRMRVVMRNSKKKTFRETNVAASGISPKLLDKPVIGKMTDGSYRLGKV